MVTYTLNESINVGGFTPLMVSALTIASFWYSATPQLAPIGAQELSITVQDVNSGWQTTFDYVETSVATFWTGLEANGDLQDAINTALFQKLAMDNKLPAGAIAVTVTPSSPPLASPPM
jgi:hypothetical protein